MKRIPLSVVGCGLLVCSVCGCATTSDPSKGGFFDGVQNISSGEYQRRQDEKREGLAALQSDGAKLRGEQTALNRQADTLDRQEQAYRQQLAQLKTDVATMETRLQKTKFQTQSKIAHKRNLEQRLANFKGQVQKTEQSGSTDAQKQQELSRLKAEKEKLQDEIVKLTSQ
jgi:chromosome segregation ATPase